MRILLLGLAIVAAIKRTGAAEQSESPIAQFRLVPDWLPEADGALLPSTNSKPEYIRSWSTYKPYLYRAQQQPQQQQQQQEQPGAAAATSAATEGECGLVVLLNGRDMWEGRGWRFTWTWPWHFMKREFEREAKLHKVLLLTPQPSKPHGCFYVQVREVASMLSLALSLNTQPVEAAEAAAEAAEAGATAPAASASLLLGTGLLEGCNKVRVYIYAACHGALIGRALFAQDGRVWHQQDSAVAAAGEAVAELQRQLLNPFFDLTSVSLIAPPLAGVRENISLVEAAAVKGGKAGAKFTAAVEWLIRLLKGNQPGATTMMWGAGSGKMYVHRDSARLICSLGAAETQPASNGGSGGARGSLMQRFRRISIFSLLDSDIVVASRSATGVSDEFRLSAAATELMQQAAAAAAAAEAARGAPEAADKAATATAALAAAENEDSSNVPRPLLPHRLPVEFAPLQKLAALDPLPDDLKALMFDDEICTRVQEPHATHKLYELSLQLVQLWGLQHQLQQQQQQEGSRRVNRLLPFGAGQRALPQGPLLPDVYAMHQQQLQQQQQQQEQQILRFLVYIPLVPDVKAMNNTPHFLSFASRTWMVPAAAPLLRAVAAAAVAEDPERLQSLTVFDTGEDWWHQ
ncbi:hypothetical protein Efla_003551 [Eimeria flavescens]